MYIESVEFARVLSDGNYGSTKAAVIIEIEPGESVEDAWEMARSQVGAQLQPAAPAPDPNDPPTWYATEPDTAPPASDPAWDALERAPAPPAPAAHPGDATGRQIKAIFAIARTKGLDPDVFAATKFGRPVADLYRGEASQLIDQLKALTAS